MKIYVLGYKGMLGRYVYTYFKSKEYNVIGLSRTDIDASDITESRLRAKLFHIGVKKDDVILNCMGTIKPMVDKLGDLNAIKVNSVFPHLLSNVCEAKGYKMIHITTDCFLPKTKVLSENGNRNIEELKINDNVYTHTGKLKKIEQRSSRHIKENIYVLKTMGNDDVKCTKNHPWFGIKRKWKEKFNFNDIEWIKTKDLSIGNLISIPKLNIPHQTIDKINFLGYSDKYKNQIDEYNFFLSNIRNKKINIKEFCRLNNLSYPKIMRWKYNENQRPTVYKLNNIFEINEDTSWLLGIFLAEGWVDNNKHRKSVIISLGDEFELINKTVNLIKKHLHITPNVRYMKNQKGTQIYFTHQLFSEMLSKDFYINNEHYSHSKKIPHWISNIGKDNIISFIKGYIDGDGCFFEDEKKSCLITMSSVSEVLIDDLKILFIKLGILPDKSKHNKRETKICGRKVNVKTSFVLTITGKQLEKAFNIFNIKSKYFNIVNRYNRFFENENYWFIPITDIIEEYYDGVVYNFEIEDDHSYLVNGGLSAHNCVFSGNDGNYNEKSPHDCIDVYGKTKSLGEPLNCTVVRTSIIGEEIEQGRSLVEWVKSMKNKGANGYTNHKWNGITCLQVAKVFEDIIENNKYWMGVKHIVSPNIVNKYVLVSTISDVYELNITINKAKDKNPIDRTMVSNYDTDFDLPTIENQIKEMKEFYPILKNN